MDRRRDLVGLERERGLVELGDSLALLHGELAAVHARPRVLGVFLRELREIAARLQLRLERVRQLLAVHEDVTDVATRSLRVVRLVRVVILLDVGVRDLDALRHVGGDSVGEKLVTPLEPVDVDRQALAGEQPLERLLAPTCVLLLDLVDLNLDVLVRDRRKPHRLRLLRQLGHRHEKLDDPVGTRLVRGRPGLRRRRLANLVDLLRGSEHVVEVGLRDGGVADDGDSVGGNALGAAAAAGGEEARDEEQGQRQETEQSHVNPRKSMAQTGRQRRDRDLHAAWRASKIASTRRSASGKGSSLLSVTSLLPTV